MTEFLVEHKTQQSKYLSSNRQRKVHKIFKTIYFEAENNLLQK